MGKPGFESWKEHECAPVSQKEEEG